MTSIVGGTVTNMMDLPSLLAPTFPGPVVRAKIVFAFSRLVRTSQKKDKKSVFQENS